MINEAAAILYTEGCNQSCCPQQCTCILQAITRLCENITNDYPKVTKEWKAHAGMEPSKTNNNTSTPSLHLVPFCRHLHKYAFFFVTCDRQTDRQTDRRMDGQTDQKRLTVGLALVGLRIQCRTSLTLCTIRKVIGSIYTHCASHNLRRTRLWNDKEIKQWDTSAQVS